MAKRLRGKSDTSLPERARDRAPDRSEHHPQSLSGDDGSVQSNMEKNRLEAVYAAYQTAEKKRAWEASVEKNFVWEKLLDQINTYVRPMLDKKIKILEIGCSLGNSLNRVTKLFHDGESYGVDIRTAPLLNGKKK